MCGFYTTGDQEPIKGYEPGTNMVIQSKSVHIVPTTFRPVLDAELQKLDASISKPGKEKYREVGTIELMDFSVIIIILLRLSSIYCHVWHVLSANMHCLI